MFLPQAGCPGRCSFCAQDLQTGKPGQTLEQALRAMNQALRAQPAGRPLEVAFYGGTFTALEPAWMERFLALTREHRERGVVLGVRCSTRPDAAAPELLGRLAGLGLDTVELGVQTFRDSALLQARRGHDGAASLRACRAVRETGLTLGLHLLPGLPGVTPEVFAQDVALAVAQEPAFVRLHPCLVLAGSGLEGPWREGAFVPWGLDATVDALARASLAFWRAGIAVARVGVAVEPALEAAVLAGPRHPALGSMVRARALFLEAKERLAGRPALTLEAPASASGEFWGHAGDLEGAWAALGLHRGNVRFQDREDFLVQYR